LGGRRYATRYNQRMIAVVALAFTLVILVRWYENCKKGGGDASGLWAGVQLLAVFGLILVVLVRALGFTVVQVSRHFRHPSKPGTVTVAGKLSIDVPVGTLGSIWKQAGLKKD
jgi:predicted RNA binding protein YcfA (HicA-like mRNA interferase family)